MQLATFGGREEALMTTASQTLGMGDTSWCQSLSFAKSGTIYY